MPAPGSNSSVARIEKGEGMVQGNFSLALAQARRSQNPASFGALKAVETDGRSMSSRSRLFCKPGLDQRLIGNIPLVSGNFYALKKRHW